MFFRFFVLISFLYLNFSIATIYSSFFNIFTRNESKYLQLITFTTKHLFFLFGIKNEIFNQKQRKSINSAWIRNRMTSKNIFLLAKLRPKFSGIFAWKQKAGFLITKKIKNFLFLIKLQKSFFFTEFNIGWTSIVSFLLFWQSKFLILVAKFLVEKSHRSNVS